MTKHPLTPTLMQLEAVLDETADAIRTKQSIDDTAMVKAKGRALLSLSHLSGEISAERLSAGEQDAIRRIREKLATERGLLERRLEASQLVVKLIGEAMLAEEWDGTYAPEAVHPVHPSRQPPAARPVQT
ncbi:hypothetical protein RDV64_17350 [Acuticoccus sp. MNP-M23]|uniref:hypothetical protein n=1 Tax=Acuticoccus sp. MNP-M23 TaxID=3072793 RepID=UPI0028166414|nr:hypothetical protein [Acuticoccus sp. MNP-M23]WMS41818.1 hypothetical protein RDV64_17350 [Acuticoccus sp. MNP-M23]